MKPVILPIPSLNGSRLVLSPLKENEIAILGKSLMSEKTWMCARRGVTDENAFHRYMSKLLVRQNAGDAVTLVARLKDSGEIAATSTFWNPAADLAKIEIGFTWVADKFMRTFVNTEKKLIMLEHAFERLKVKRVEFSVDPTNEKSNAAMIRIGAKLEGTLRKWRFLSDEDSGNRNIYSIIDDEWPEVRSLLKSHLARAK
jgi:RimJ/RimL family protein N-acetyltransferase